MFVIGERVYHEQYGEGTVIAYRNDFDKLVVRFDESKERDVYRVNLRKA